MNVADKARATVHAERNDGIQIGEQHENVDTKNISNPTFHATAHHENVQVKHEHHYHGYAAPGIDTYFRGLGVDPEDSRTKALASAGDKPIKSCWGRILATAEFEEWRRSQDVCVLWIVGGPGKGKSILSLGLLDELAHGTQHDNNNKAFVAYFFCRDTDGTANTAISILKGLVYGLGQEDRDLMRFLSDKFRSPEDVKGAGMDTMWGILTKMLTAMKGIGAIYLVIDALDECHNEEEVRDFLDLVRKASFRRSVKWVFTSRQSLCIRRSLGSAAGVYTIDLDTSREVEQGVDEYLDIAIGANQRLSGPQKQQVLEMLRADADKTFLYVRLVLEDLRMASDVDISKWILDLKNNVHGKSVYQRYRLMLRRVIEGDEGSGTTTLQDLLKAVVLANETLSLQEVAVAAGLPFSFYDPCPESGSDRRTAELVQQCGHFLRVAEGKVYLVHKSAKDYLTIGDGTDEGPFLSSSPAEHALIAERSLLAMGPDLLPTPDLSSLGSLIVRNPSQKSLQRMEGLRNIYSHWSHHIIQAQGAFSGWHLVEHFLETRLLAWAEVMGHLGEVQRCIDMVLELRAAIESEGCDATASRGSKALLDDAFQFLVRYRPMIRAHPRQVYLLAKGFTPKTSLTRANYENIPCRLTIGNNPPADWDPCQYTLDVSGHQWGDKDMRKVTSPRYDRSGFNLDHYWFSFVSRDFRLDFSADSKTFSVGSSTLGRSTLRWNVADGSFAGSFDATEDGLAQSSDGGLFASWSERGIGLWDVGTNMLICRLENSGSSDRRCTSVRFSSDGSAIAAAFSESFLLRKTKRTLVLWDAREGSLLREIDLDGEVIRDLSFMRGGRTLALCIRSTLILHDVRGHKSRRVPLGDSEEPNGVAFSGDGNIIVFITRSTVAFYNVEPLKEVARWSVPRDKVGLQQYFREEEWWTRPKPNLGIEVAVSGDAKTAVLGFRDTIALFRLDERSLCPAYHSTTKHGRIKNEGFFQSKLPIIDALKFSPCGGYLACARNDDIISIWDVRAACQVPTEDGVVIPDPDSRRKIDPYHIHTYSPDGKVCGTKGDGRVHLWEVGTASAKLHVEGSPSLGYNYNRRCSTLSWAFSPDSVFAVTAIELTMHLVNIRDWGHNELALPGHVAALAFSPQGRHLALATCNLPPVVLLFETASRQCLLRYEAICHGIHAMAFASGGTLIAAGAASKSFCYYVWEESQYTNPGACEPPQRYRTQRPADGSRIGTGDMQIMRIESFPGPFTAVSVICNFTTLEGMTSYSAHAEEITVRRTEMTSRRTGFIKERSADHSNYLEVGVRGHDYKAAVKRELAHCDGVELLVAFRVGRRAAGMTANGINIAPPAEQNRCSCHGVEIEQDSRFSWVTWKGRRLLCFPLSISLAQCDPWETCLMVTHELDNTWFISYVS